MLGERVRMLGFSRFRGGLDAKSTHRHTHTSARAKRYRAGQGMADLLCACGVFTQPTRRAPTLYIPSIGGRRSCFTSAPCCPSFPRIRSRSSASDTWATTWSSSSSARDPTTSFHPSPSAPSSIVHSSALPCWGTHTQHTRHPHDTHNTRRTTHATHTRTRTRTLQQMCTSLSRRRRRRARRRATGWRWCVSRG
jgi:hypothetical protein